MAFKERNREEKEFTEKLIRLNRVSKAVKGGRKMSFSALMVVGDGKGRVGFGFGKANDVAEAAEIAASLSMFSMSAPEKPTVLSETCSQLIPLTNFLPLAWIFNIPCLPSLSGISSITRLSNLPGLKSAGSRRSPRFVAATTTTLSFGVNPSISTSIWFSVCSRSSWPPIKPRPLCLPIASISSIKIIEGADNFDLVAYMTTSGDIAEGWVYQAYSQYNAKLIGGMLSMMTTSIKPYYDSGQLLGLMDGIKGAADLEFLTNNPGDAIVSSDILSFTQTLVLIFIIIGNVAFWMQRQEGS